MKARVVVVAVTVALGAVLLLFFSTQFFGRPKSSSGSQVIVDGRLLTVEVANEPQERTLGLMFRESLPSDHGMLFVFDSDGSYGFWMMNVKFSLDIVWIDSDSKVVHVEKNVPPCSLNCPVYQSKTPARYVLEVRGGSADEVGLREGAQIKITLAPR